MEKHHGKRHGRRHGKYKSLRAFGGLTLQHLYTYMYNVRIFARLITGKISRRMSWFLLATASTVKQACTSLTKKQFRSMQIITLTSCCQHYWTTDCRQLPTVYFSTRSKVTQQWVATHCPDFIDKDSWPPNIPDINPLDYNVWGLMLEKFCHLNSRPKDIPELKSALMKIWNDLSQAFLMICRKYKCF